MVTQEQLDVLVDDVTELGSRILGLDKLLNSIEDQALQAHYMRDLLELIHYYKGMNDILEENLKEYIDYEKQQPSNVVNIKYRRLLKIVETSRHMIDNYKPTV